MKPQSPLLFNYHLVFTILSRVCNDWSKVTCIGMFVSQIDTVMEMEKNMGLAGEDDMDDLKSMFLETNIYLLILTGVY